MTSAVQTSGSPSGSGSSSLADVLETILDKGIVIDAHVSVGIVGIELLTVDARVVVASVDTYLRFAEAVNRLDLSEHEGKGLPEVVEGTKKGGALGKAGDLLGELVDGPDQREKPRRRRES